VDSETGRAAGERRRHPRYAEDARVLCVADAGAGFQDARLVELSADGMRLVAREPFAPGEELYAGVFLEDAQEPLVVRGVVQHCDPEPRGAAVGVKLLGATDEQRDALARLEAYLERRHGAEALVTLRAVPAIKRVSDERWW
jgi:hypothetical protein